MSRLQRIVWVPVALAALISACTGASTASPSGAPTATQPVADSDCGPLDLRTPSGTEIDLTGTWRGGISGLVHYIRQVGSCLWWVGLGDDPNEAMGAQAIVTFRGELQSDFTVTGEWMSVNRPPFVSEPQYGAVTFEIEIQPGSDGEMITLRSTEPEGDAGGVGPYQGFLTLDYEGPLPAVPLR